MTLQDLKSNVKSRKKRVGRGNGSKKGTYATRGMNGQNSRSGGGVRPGFEGGQTPFLRKTPKSKGFKNINRVEFQIVNTGSLNVFNDGDIVNLESLLEKNILRKKDQPVKLLSGKGTLAKKLEIIVHKASKSALQEVEKTSSKLTVLITETPKKNKTE